MSVVAPPPGRFRTVLLSFGPFFATVVFAILAGVLAEVAAPAAIVCGILAVVAFFAWPILMWVWLLRAARLNNEASRAWYEGRNAEARTKARDVLATAFRADVRTRAMHLLGLAAEAEGSFEEAADRFHRALAEMPAMAAPVHKRTARVLMNAHRAFCLAVVGRVPEAEAILMEVNRDYLDRSRGAADMFLDDASWGLGTVSINHALVNIEHGRDPRAVVALAWGTVFHRRGNASALHDLLVRDAHLVATALFPRERALLEHFRADATQRLAASPMRGAGIVGEVPLDAWAARAFAGR